MELPSTINPLDLRGPIHAHQFAVVIDSQWQTDPVSSTHDFLVTDLGSCGE